MIRNTSYHFFRELGAPSFLFPLIVLFLHSESRKYNNSANIKYYLVSCTLTSELAQILRRTVSAVCQWALCAKEMRYTIRSLGAEYIC